MSQIRRWFVADTTSGPGESFSGHRETRRLSRTVPGPQVRAVLQLQHGRYGDERHDAEQQGQQHQSLRYAGTRSPRVVLHIRARLPSAYVYACACIYMCICTCIIYTCINIRVAHVRNRGYVYVCTEQQSIRLTAINTLSPCTLFSRPPLLPLPLPPLLYHPQRCTRMVQLTHRTIMRYRNSARCPCSTRTEQDAAHPPRPPPPRPATRTPSSPRPRRAEIRRRTRRYVYIEKCQLTFEWRIVNYVVLLNDEIAEI